MMLRPDKRISDIARRAIAGIMEMAPSITAMGNCTPSSYFRLVPHQEAPTNVCWGDRNRSVLVRVPLGWTADVDMCAAANPGSKGSTADTTFKQTVELRSADGSANIYLLMAALTVACRHGFEMPDALRKADDTYVDIDIHRPEHRARLEALEHLPANCDQSARALEQQRAIYEEKGVFPPAVIDSIISSLKSFDDCRLSESARADQSVMASIVERYFHCG